MAAASEYSEYFSTLLDVNTRDRYLQKIALCDGIDPYCLKKVDFSVDIKDFPSLEFPDISNYLVLQTSFYSTKQMKAYKSLEAYNFFVCGWVYDLGVKNIKDELCVVYARVNHSQKSRETPLKTWVIIKKNGEVLTAHCNCMAGLAESCSHVGALLYAVEAGVRMRESVTCTMEKSKWLMPARVKEIPAAPVAKIDFSSARAKKKKMDDAITGTMTPVDHKVIVSKCPRVDTSSDTYQEFYDTLNKSCPRSAALMTSEKHYKQFIPKSATDMLPKCMLDYRTSVTLQLPPQELRELCQSFTLLELTESQINAVKRETQKQSGSKIWYHQRAGRITASKLKQVLRTNLEKPSISLMKAICYPESNRFSTAATRYGCKHEKKAREEYEGLMSAKHENFSVVDSGLHLNQKWPYMGATPDGVVMCNCCGTGACEIKCPYCHEDKENLTELAGEKSFCLQVDDDGKVGLDRNHAYYYQVQAQLHIMETDYCDFVVWNRNDIFVERIVPDSEFWEEIIPKVECFFRKNILPEVLGQQFTKLKITSHVSILNQLNINRSP